MRACCSLPGARVTAEAAAERPHGATKRVCYLVNFQARDVDQRPQGEQEASQFNKRQRGNQQMISGHVISSSERGDKQQQQQSQQAAQHPRHQRHEDQLNRMRERLFRLLSKVPIQVESINNNKDNLSSTRPLVTSTIAQGATRGDRLRDPLLIKYYQERSMASIIDLHFACSLIKQPQHQTGFVPPPTTSNVAQATMFSNNQTIWPAASNKCAGSGRTNLMPKVGQQSGEFIGQQQAAPAGNQATPQQQRRARASNGTTMGKQQQQQLVVAVRRQQLGTAAAAAVAMARQRQCHSTASSSCSSCSSAGASSPAVAASNFLVASEQQQQHDESSLNLLNSTTSYHNQHVLPTGAFYNNNDHHITTATENYLQSAHANDQQVSNSINCHTYGTRRELCHNNNSTTTTTTTTNTYNLALDPQQHGDGPPVGFVCHDYASPPQPHAAFQQQAQFVDHQHHEQQQQQLTCIVWPHHQANYANCQQQQQQADCLFDNPNPFHAAYQNYQPVESPFNTTTSYHHQPVAFNTNPSAIASNQMIEHANNYNNNNNFAPKTQLVYQTTSNQTQSSSSASSTTSCSSSIAPAAAAAAANGGASPAVSPVRQNNYSQSNQNYAPGYTNQNDQPLYGYGQAPICMEPTGGCSSINVGDVQAASNGLLLELASQQAAPIRTG